MEILNFEDLDQVYFLGIGGIGMSALARYFNNCGYHVAGYDRISSPLTESLEKEGIAVNYEDTEEAVPAPFRRIENTLLVYTPAIPEDSVQRNWFLKHGFTLYKRAQVLGILSRKGKALCVAGTHGKTTTTTLLAYLMDHSRIGCNAFLGGISRNYGTNLLLNRNSEYIVIEADEFDRSFLNLTPYVAAVTAMDNDHMDVYGTREAMLEAFTEYALRTRKDGCVILKDGLSFYGPSADRVSVGETYSISAETASCKAKNISIVDGLYEFDYSGSGVEIRRLRLGIPGKMNVENAVLAITIALKCGVSPEEISCALPEFKGVERRFNVHVSQNGNLYIDDYAHHPEEIKATLNVVREMWPDLKLTVIFQPHLYTRTRDFYKGFADSLNLADEVVLTDIYPAREKAIPGISSDIIRKLLKVPSAVIDKDRVIDYLEDNFHGGVLLTLGAGNIDRKVPLIAEWMEKNC